MAESLTNNLVGRRVRLVKIHHRFNQGLAKNLDNTGTVILDTPIRKVRHCFVKFDGESEKAVINRWFVRPRYLEVLDEPESTPQTLPPSSP